MVFPAYHRDSSPEKIGTVSGWYDTLRLFLVLTGQEFVMPFGWPSFSELLRTIAVWHAHPEELRQSPTIDGRSFPASHRHPGYDRLPRWAAHHFAGGGVYRPGPETDWVGERRNTVLIQ